MDQDRRMHEAFRRNAVTLLDRFEDVSGLQITPVTAAPNQPSHASENAKHHWPPPRPHAQNKAHPLIPDLSFRGTGKTPHSCPDFATAWARAPLARLEITRTERRLFPSGIRGGRKALHKLPEFTNYLPRPRAELATLCPALPPALSLHLQQCRGPKVSVTTSILPEIDDNPRTLIVQKPPPKPPDSPLCSRLRQV